MTPVTVTPRIVPLSPLPRLAGDSGVALAMAAAVLLLVLTMSKRS